MIEDGPFKTSLEASKDGVLKEIYITYKVRNGMLIKETATRNHKSAFSEEYHDTSTVEPLLDLKNGI
jgi:hypothetical protein